MKKRLGIIICPDGFFRIAERKSIKPLAGEWNIYRTYTGAAAGLRAYRRHGPPGRIGLHVTPECIKAMRRVR